MKQKHFLIIGLVAIVLMAAQKIEKAPVTCLGIISMSHISQQLPEVQQANTALDTLKAQLSRELKGKVNTYNTQLEDFEKEKTTLTGLILKDRQEALQQMEASIKSFQQAAGNELQDKEKELFEPLRTKINQAIATVAREQGYTHVINQDQGQLLMYTKDGTTIDRQVLEKLGIATTQDKPFKKN